MIPGLGRSTGERIVYSLQDSWASLVAQLVKNLPSMRDQGLSLYWEDPLEKGKATHSSWRIHSMDCIVHGVTKSQTGLSDFWGKKTKQNKNKTLRIKILTAISVSKGCCSHQTIVNTLLSPEW